MDSDKKSGKTSLTIDEIQKMAEGIDAEALKKMREEHTPLPGSVCKTEKCGGRVTRRVASLFRGRYSFHLPQCEKCGRDYLYADDAPEVGVAEFERILNQPFTI